MRYNNINHELVQTVRPNYLMKYLESNGWEKAEIIPGDIAVYTQEDLEAIIPLDESYSDYTRRVWDVIQILTSQLNQAPHRILNDVLLYWADILRIKINDSDSEGGTVDLNHGVDLIGGGRQALAAAARQSRKFQRHYSKLLVEDVDNYLSTCRLGWSLEVLLH